MHYCSGFVFKMRKYLYWWNKLSKESKAELKSKHNTTTVTYSFIKMVWEEINNFKTK